MAMTEHVSSLDAVPPAKSAAALFNSIRSLAGFFIAWVNACADYYAAAAIYEQLNRLSDAELHKRGLSRDTLSRDSANPATGRLTGERSAAAVGTFQDIAGRDSPRALYSGSWSCLPWQQLVARSALPLFSCWPLPLWGRGVALRLVTIRPRRSGARDPIVGRRIDRDFRSSQSFEHRRICLFGDRRGDDFPSRARRR